MMMMMMFCSGKGKGRAAEEVTTEPSGWWITGQHRAPVMSHHHLLKFHLYSCRAESRWTCMRCQTSWRYNQHRNTDRPWSKCSNCLKGSWLGSMINRIQIRIKANIDNWWVVEITYSVTHLRLAASKMWRSDVFPSILGNWWALLSFLTFKD